MGQCEDERQLCCSEGRKWHRNRLFREVGWIAGRRMHLRVIETSGERFLEELLEVAAVLHDMVEFFKNALELFVESSQNVGVLVLILDDAPLIGDDMTLHLSSLQTALKLYK